MNCMNCAVFKYCMIVRALFQISLSVIEWESEAPPSYWLVGCFGFNGPLRQYFSLYRAVSQREGEREEK